VSKQFTLFKSECAKWLDRLSLHDWEVNYELSPIDGGLAWCSANLDGREATMGLNPDVKMTDAEVRACAKHECLELLVAPLDTLASRRYVTPSDIECARHAIVRRLEHALK